MLKQNYPPGQVVSILKFACNEYLDTLYFTQLRQQKAHGFHGFMVHVQLQIKKVCLLDYFTVV